MSRMEKQPANRRGWKTLGPWKTDLTVTGTVLSRGRARVITSVDMAEAPSGSDVIPQWHVSISERGGRPTAKSVERVLAALDMSDAEEDNHHPGVARHFWKPVDPTRRVDCECKVDEDLIVDADGYKWTNPAPGSSEGCRGCEFERMSGKECPVHRLASGYPRIPPG